MSLQKLPHAGLLKRIVAAAIDFVILFLLLQGPILLLFFWNIDGYLDFCRRPVAEYFQFVLLLCFAIFPFGLHDMPRGRGFGKWVMGLRIVDATDPTRPPSLARLFLRSVTNPISPVGMASAMNHPEKTRFGDRLANTLVVEDAASRLGMRQFLRWMAGGVAAVLAIIISGQYVGPRCLLQLAKNSAIYPAIVEKASSYEPLRDVVGAIDREQLHASYAKFGIKAGLKEGGVVVLFRYTGEKASGTILVVFERGLTYDPDWHATDTTGLVKLSSPAADSGYGWLFREASKFGRYVTEEQYNDLDKGLKTPYELFPDFATEEEKKAIEDQKRKEQEKTATPPDNQPKTPVPAPLSSDNETKAE